MSSKKQIASLSILLVIIFSIALLYPIPQKSTSVINGYSIFDSFSRLSAQECTTNDDCNQGYRQCGVSVELFNGGLDACTYSTVYQPRCVQGKCHYREQGYVADRCTTSCSTDGRAVIHQKCVEPTDAFGKQIADAYCSSTSAKQEICEYPLSCKPSQEQPCTIAPTVQCLPPEEQ